VCLDNDCINSTDASKINSLLATQAIPDISEHHKMFSPVYNKISAVCTEETNGKCVAGIKSVFKGLVVERSRNVRNRPGVCP